MEKMNNYISAEEFLKQPERVQKVLTEWWQPQFGDLYCDVNAYDIDYICCVLNKYKIGCIKVDKQYNYYIPLLQLRQLIQFIQDKTNCKLNIENYNEADILFRLCKGGEEIRSHMFYDTSSLLQTIFKLACKIVEEDKNGNK